ENCQFNLEANDPRCPVVFEGWANDMGANWTGHIDVRSTKFHPYSESLLDGLQKKPEAVRVIQDMNFAGMLAANGFIKKSTPKEPADVRFNVNIHGGELRHRLFSYRMFGLTGMVSLVNGVVSAERIEGVSSTGNITISGQSIPGSQWWVNVVGRAVELNQELYQALSANQKSVWDQISPQGTLDHLLVRVQNLGTGLQVSVDAYQQPSTPRDPSNLRIEPNWFRYALDRLSGKVHYSNGEIKISDIQGWHGNIPVSFDADGQSHAEYWQMTIRNLLTGQIPIDHDIKQALPQSVRAAANRMALTGSVVVQGNVSIFQRLNLPTSVDVATIGSRAIAHVGHMTSTEEATVLDALYRGAPLVDPPGGLGRPNLAWDLRIDIENAAATLGVPVQHIHGNMQLRGLSNQETAFCGGRVHFDSAMVQGVQTTAIQGPYWCDEHNVLFGTAVGQLPAEIQSQSCGSIDSVTANCFGGRVSMDGQVVLHDEIQFQIQSSASQIDLAQLAKELAPQTREIVGFASASLVLNGTSTGTHSLDGGGRIHINDAKLYEVPFFLQLLKTLHVKTPDKTAFDKGLIDFGIKGSDIECHRIELNGDAISLIGNGRANLSQELDLNFYTVLGRNNIYLPVLSDLVHAGSQQLLWISVKGTVEKPLLTRETFRALNEAVRLLLEPQE
ncbi:MAG: AsmA-like C-terminal region-containing protein, partial [Pirellulaceae bacterium]|nr:AsmA-like C-terminal region-containing protein [Pirellulaceae bacterium]